jgi:hypothetical protein
MLNGERHGKIAPSPKTKQHPNNIVIIMPLILTKRSETELNKNIDI